MKLAIIGSRNLQISNLGDYILRLEKFTSEEVSEIVSGGARGVDSCAKKFALENNLKLTEFLPEYDKYQRSAPLKRNIQIIDYADVVMAFWDGKSRGTEYVIRNCKLKKKKIIIFEKK